jgi:hypothetical protein
VVSVSVGVECWCGVSVSIVGDICSGMLVLSVSVEFIWCWCWCLVLVLVLSVELLVLNC